MIRLEIWSDPQGLGTSLHHDDAYESVLKIFADFEVLVTTSKMQVWYVDSETRTEEIMLLEYERTSDA